MKFDFFSNTVPLKLLLFWKLSKPKISFLLNTIRPWNSLKLSFEKGRFRSRSLYVLEVCCILALCFYVNHIHESHSFFYYEILEKKTHEKCKPTKYFIYEVFCGTFLGVQKNVLKPTIYCLDHPMKRILPHLFAKHNRKSSTTKKV